MSRWRAIALEHLPDLRCTVETAPNVMALWIELLSEYQRAREHPRNDDLARRIRAYAEWCTQSPRTDAPEHDPPTAVWLAFYEHLAEDERP